VELGVQSKHRTLTYKHILQVLKNEVLEGGAMPRPQAQRASRPFYSRPSKLFPSTLASSLRSAVGS
jgi:hypothetical protein